MRRYKGLAAGIYSCCDAAVLVAQQAGVAHVSSLSSKDAAQSQNAFPEARNATDQILAALGELLASYIHKNHWHHGRHLVCWRNLHLVLQVKCFDAIRSTAARLMGISVR